MQEPKATPQTLSEGRDALFEQLSGVLATHGRPLDMEAYTLLQPLLNGSLGYGEHEDMLNRLLESLAHDQA